VSWWYLARFTLFFAMTIVACSSDEESGTDENRPDTFGDPCSDDATCRGRFTCLEEGEQLAGRICTTTCASDAECPSWVATGHCAGPSGSMCMSSVCMPMLCK
jgi:hypothetical protein